MPKKNVKSVGILQIRYYPVEDAYIKKFIEKGYDISSLIRNWILEKGQKEFPEQPLYAKVAAERLALRKQTVEERQAIEKMTNEEYATKVVRGRIVGDKVLFMAGRGMIVTVPLAMVKEKNVDNTIWMQNHFDILDHKFLNANGEPFSEEDHNEMITEWENAG